MTLTYVGLGANIDDPRRHLEQAIEELAGLPQSKLIAKSGIYRTAPLGYADQPDFLNAVAAIETGLAAEALLAHLQDIERRHGRERPFPNAPRTLDLDLLLYGSDSIATPRLTVPHPRMHERAFVLQPLVDISPDAEIPGLGPARTLLAACQNQAVERMR